MSDRLDGSYIPLPKKLPQQDEKSHSSSSDEDKRRSRKGKEKARIVHHNDDPEYYPVVETPTSVSSGRRDSGVFSGTGSPRDAKYYDKKGRLLTAAERRPVSSSGEAAIQDLTTQFNKIITNERVDKLEAEARANRLEEQLNKAKAEIEQTKRASWLDDRERRVSDREKTHRDDKRLSQTSSRQSPNRRDVVVSQPQPPARVEDAATAALNKARADAQRKRDSKDFGRKYS